MRYNLYREALCGQSIGWVQGYLTNHVLRDASETMHHLAAKSSYLVHFLPIEEIAIVVEHQDRQNRLQPWSSRTFPFTTTARCFKLMIPPKNAIIIRRLLLAQ
ncbi:hypothetical protein TNCV_1233131 [Trichonephila clavipes]|nr:hypothetical protein TNCV_1233131 [Trichonephila clavipes]